MSDYPLTQKYSAQYWPARLFLDTLTEPITSIFTGQQNWIMDGLAEEKKRQEEERKRVDEERKRMEVERKNAEEARRRMDERELARSPLSVTIRPDGAVMRKIVTPNGVVYRDPIGTSASVDGRARAVEAARMRSNAMMPPPLEPLPIVPPPDAVALSLPDFQPGQMPLFLPAIEPTGPRLEELFALESNANGREERRRMKKRKRERHEELFALASGGPRLGERDDEDYGNKNIGDNAYTIARKQATKRGKKQRLAVKKASARCKKGRAARKKAGTRRKTVMRATRKRSSGRSTKTGKARRR